jgi:hypothetical protein
MVEQTLVTFAFADVTVRIREFIYTFLSCLASAEQLTTAMRFFAKGRKRRGSGGDRQLHQHL